MDTTHSTRPVVRLGRCGWLAASPPGHRYHFAVVGDSEQEARDRFMAADKAWQRLDAQVQAEKAPEQRRGELDSEQAS